MKLEVLVSAVEKDAAALLAQMHIASDAVLVDQCDRYGYETVPTPGGTARCFYMPERGVGLSRNTALLHAAGEAVLFSDEDIVLAKGYEEMIADAYRALPDADLILFNVKVAPARRTYWNGAVCRVNWKNYGRYPAYSISAKLASLRRANAHYSLLFGGGAKYSNGEDSLFLRDCLRAGLKVYAHTACIGEEKERPSTWFSGYHETFFRDRGVLYHHLYGKLALPLALRFLLAHKEVMCREIPVRKAYRIMREGVREARGG
ncbi:MAG: glycosyltransferase family 2 protein [Bacteroidales bacterium]|nr:glycosyltransferase family 2 protein [Bacteroidales bacterium]MCM1415531.1 glycosyltransferase family 2 protein [bacterium]MCM1423731.1 glycosyltransferase family 2 protein [bacterium]